MLLINAISIYLLALSVTAVFCAVQIRALNGASYTRTVLLLGFAICFYILGYTMELNSFIPANIVFWNRVEYTGIPFVSALWFTTGLMYTGCFARHKRILVPAIYGIPVVTLLLRLTNHYHHLYFASEDFVSRFGSVLYVKHPGPWMYVQIVHSALMIFLSMGLLLYDCAKCEKKQVGKILLIIGASLLAVAGLCLTQLRPFDFPIDYMALCLPITCVMVIMAILRYDLLETKSIARSKVFDAGGDALLLVNRQNVVLDYNSSARRLMGQLNLSLSGKALSALFAEIPDLLEALEKAEPSVVKLRVREEERYYQVSTENIDDHNILRGWIKTIRDITEIYRLNEELKRQAMTDELSVLINRRAFIHIGREWVSKSEHSDSSLHLLMMDLDYFKDVNDQYGHPTGDLVIRDFSQMLKSHFPENSLVARLGGEEFAVLLEGYGDDEMLQMINAFRIAAQQHTYAYFGNRFHVTVSVGMTKRQPGQALESMMGKADRALYRSKDLGRNCSTVIVNESATHT